MEVTRTRRSGWTVLATALVLAVSCGAPSLPVGPAPEAVPTAADAATPPDGPTKVIAYYFHGTVRCQTCLDIERVARETVLDQFLAYLDEGTLEWRSVNYDVPENAHYSRDYALPSPSLVLVRERAGYPVAFELLGETWDRVAAPDRLREYVRDKVAAFLADAGNRHREAGIAREQTTDGHR